VKPLDPLNEVGDLELLLASGAIPLVRAELVRLEDSTLDDRGVVALLYARGELALRAGSFEEAHGFLGHAADGYRDLGEREAEDLTRIEAHIAVAKRGPRAASLEAAAELARLSTAVSSERAGVAAELARGIAQRAAGDLAGARAAWSAALSKGEGMPDLRMRVANELGGLYLSTGAAGAARSLFSRAAELARRLDHAVIELCAQQGLAQAATLRGELTVARRHLLRAESIAERLDDRPARVAALCELSELASLWERHGDALELARKALSLTEDADATTERPRAWASRALARAMMELGDAEAEGHVAHARSAFEKLGDRLGESLTRWDAAALGERSRTPGGDDGWFEPAWTLATMGEARRVLELLADRRESSGGAAAPEPEDVARLALAERFPSLVEEIEVELLSERPERLVPLSLERADAHRNAARLSVLSTGRRGLMLAAVVSPVIGVKRHAYPAATAAAVLVGQLPGVCVWAWRPPHHGSVVARDLSALRAALGNQTRAVVGRFVQARVSSPGFGAGAGAQVEGADVPALVAAALAASPAALVLWHETGGAGSLDWDAECDVVAKMAGFAVSRR
jgi:tetratricopeptide (TPR) repeat protein